MLEQEILKYVQNDVLSVIALSLTLMLLLAIYALYRSYRSNRVRLLNGYLLSLSVGVLILLLTTLIIMTANEILIVIWLALISVLGLGVLLISIFLWLFLIINGIIMWRRESRNLANSLTLLLGAGLIIYPMIIGWLSKILPKWLITLLNTIENLSWAYLLLNFIAFIFSFMILRLIRPKYDKDYLIVLGAGLINGKTVSNLLASRIKRAITFAEKQISIKNKTPYIILSGGQGSDESLPEGQAMKEFIINEGLYNSSYLIAETKSLNTLENMQFSKQIVQDHGWDLRKGLFATSDYHVYRATGYALFAGLNINGLGAKTRKYFVPSAILREYIAILMQHKRLHLIIFVLILLISLSSGIFTGFQTNWR